MAMFFLGWLSSYPAAAGPRPPSCTTAREYVTTLEFLRDRKDVSGTVAVNDTQAREIARTVSDGCTGAAQRFIRVSSVLTKAGLGAKDALRKGVEFAARTDMETETFVTVFRKSFFKEELDLDLLTSLRTAESLTREFEGDTLAVRDDFDRLVSFCAGSKSLNLPTPQCAGFAARVAKLGARWSGGVAAPFVRSYEYLTSESGPHFGSGQALQIAEKLIAGGPDAPDNFITAYKYAVNQKGLGLGDGAAVQFAMEMGLRDTRSPASARTGN
jgi:hypothetical protein